LVVHIRNINNIFFGYKDVGGVIKGAVLAIQGKTGDNPGKAVAGFIIPFNNDDTVVPRIAEKYQIILNKKSLGVTEIFHPQIRAGEIGAYPVCVGRLDNAPPGIVVVGIIGWFSGDPANQEKGQKYNGIPGFFSLHSHYMIILLEKIRE
jgi:hypothetical protein